MYQIKYIKANFTYSNTILIRVPENCSGGTGFTRCPRKWQDEQPICLGTPFKGGNTRLHERKWAIFEEVFYTEARRQMACNRWFLWLSVLARRKVMLGDRLNIRGWKALPDLRRAQTRPQPCTVCFYRDPRPCAMCLNRASHLCGVYRDPHPCVVCLYRDPHLCAMCLYRET